jgi:hypothetical protein
VRSGGTLNKRWLQTNRFVGTHGAIDASRNDLLRLLKERCRLR